MSHDVEAKFNVLGYLSQLRGLHSSGIIGVSRQAPQHGEFNYMTLKDACTFSELSLSSSYDDLTSQRNLKLLMGHNRHATMGKINKHNAHPYYDESVGNPTIIGMHNGTMPTLSPPKKQEEKMTDSRLFYEMLELYVNDGKSFKELRDDALHACDAYALTWVNTVTNTFHVVRNAQRTLYHASTEHGNEMIYASEEMFINAVRSYGKNVTVFKDPIAFEPNVLYSWEIGNARKMEREELGSVSTVYSYSDYLNKGGDKETASPLSRKFRGGGHRATPLLTQENTSPSSSNEVTKESIPLPQQSGKQSYVFDPVSKELVPKERWDDLVKERREEARSTSTSGATRSDLPYRTAAGGLKYLPAEYVRKDIAAQKDQNYPQYETIRGIKYVLKYVGWQNRVCNVSFARKTLRKGDAIEDKKYSLKDKVYWVGPKTFIGHHLIKDDFVQGEFKDFYIGSLGYFKQTDITEQHKKGNTL